MRPWPPDGIESAGVNARSRPAITHRLLQRLQMAADAAKQVAELRLLFGRERFQVLAMNSTIAGTNPAQASAPAGVSLAKVKRRSVGLKTRSTQPSSYNESMISCSTNGVLDCRDRRVNLGLLLWGRGQLPESPQR
jgi:hypothetical protein